MHLENVNPNKLHDELVNAGVICIVKNDLQDGEYIAENTWISFIDGTDMSLVQQIVDAHDPTPLPKPPTDKERLEAAEQAIIMLMMEG